MAQSIVHQVIVIDEGAARFETLQLVVAEFQANSELVKLIRARRPQADAWSIVNVEQVTDGWEVTAFVFSRYDEAVS